jgi:hypothetical protein
MKQISLRLSEQWIEQIKNESIKRNISQTDFISQALDHFLTCRTPEKSTTKSTISLKEIINSYKDSHCTSCNKVIALGEPFLWGKDEGGSTIRLCQDCQVKASGDKTLMGLDLKKRKLRRLIKSYENQLDQLAIQFESKEIFQQEQDTLRNLAEMNKMLVDILSLIEYNKSIGSNLSTDQLEQKINDLLEIARRAITYIDDFESFRETYLKIKSNLKKKIIEENRQE